jgi:hypothetical protein
MSSEEGVNHIDVPKPYKEQKSPYKDENAEEPEGPKPGIYALLPVVLVEGWQRVSDNVHIGLLRHVGDPLGKGLETVLKPVGAPLGYVTKPLGDVLGGATKPALGPLMGHKDEKMEALGGDNKDSYVHGKDTIGGHLQTSDNPLGLNQTGNDKFRD